MATTLGSEFLSSGVNEETPKHIMLGAGTVHVGLMYDGEKNEWNFSNSLLCATSGGSKLSIVPELYDVPVDGVLVKTKGLTVKVGETATLEINPIELSPNVLQYALIGDVAECLGATGYSEITSRANIKANDYVNDLAYVGKTIEGRPIIVQFGYALCTSGFELEGKNKEAAVPALTFECYAELGVNTTEADKLPWRVIYPTAIN